MSIRYNRISGSHFSISTAWCFREETRRWYARIEKPAGTVTVKVYDDQTEATNGTDQYSASGAVAVSVGDTSLTIPLDDNASRGPTFGDAASIVVIFDSSASTGTEVWKIDLGKKLERAILRVLRLLSGITIDNGYFTNPVIERGMRQWEDVHVFPWVGVVGATLTAEPQELGAGPLGAGWLTSYVIRLLAHDAISYVGEPTALFLYHDIRRALADSLTTAFDGPVNDGIPFDSINIEGIENDLAVVWSRDRSTIEVNLTVRIYESQSEIRTG
jgi:hypothetical protein